MYLRGRRSWRRREAHRATPSTGYALHSAYPLTLAAVCCRFYAGTIHGCGNLRCRPPCVTGRCLVGCHGLRANSLNCCVYHVQTDVKHLHRGHTRMILINHSPEHSCCVCMRAGGNCTMDTWSGTIMEHGRPLPASFPSCHRVYVCVCVCVCARTHTHTGAYAHACVEEACVCTHRESTFFSYVYTQFVRACLCGWAIYAKKAKLHIDVIHSTSRAPILTSLVCVYANVCVYVFPRARRCLFSYFQTWSPQDGRRE